MRGLLLAAVMTLAACGAPPAKEAENAPALNAPAQKARLETTELAGSFLVGVAPATAAPATYPDLARDACGTRSFCKVGIWTNPQLLPRGFPMTDREAAAQIFQYSLNRDTGFEQTLWNCEVAPQSDPANCGLGPT